MMDLHMGTRCRLASALLVAHTGLREAAFAGAWVVKLAVSQSAPLRGSAKDCLPCASSSTAPVDRRTETRTALSTTANRRHTTNTGTHLGRRLMVAAAASRGRGAPLSGVVVVVDVVAGASPAAESNKTWAAGLGERDTYETFLAKPQSAGESWQQVSLAQTFLNMGLRSQANLAENLWLHFKRECRDEKCRDFSTGSVMLLEPRALRPFKTSEEYLYAMKEDLAEWLNGLYSLNITVDCFMDKLETGVALCESFIWALMGELLENYGLQTGSVMLLEPRALRPFKTSEEYLYAMKEDLAEWLNGLYSLNITVDCFMDKLETGVALCELGIIDCLLFETEDLVARKNEKSVVLCLLEVARRGARFGMAAPLLVQFEREIDRDIAKDQRQEIKIQDSGDVFAACDVDGCASDTQPAGREPVVKQMSVQMETVNGGIASMVSTVSTVSTTAMTSASVVGVIDDDDDDSSIADSCGSCPQIVTNDLKSLDEMGEEKNTT
ncbi:unnamed protein product, partial [Notodromas monacha]